MMIYGSPEKQWPNTYRKNEIIVKQTIFIFRYYKRYDRTKIAKER